MDADKLADNLTDALQENKVLKSLLVGNTRLLQACYRLAEDQGHPLGPPIEFTQQMSLEEIGQRVGAAVQPALAAASEAARTRTESPVAAQSGAKGSSRTTKAEKRRLRALETHASQNGTVG